MQGSGLYIKGVKHVAHPKREGKKRKRRKKRPKCSSGQAACTDPESSTLSHSESNPASHLSSPTNLNSAPGPSTDAPLIDLNSPPPSIPEENNNGLMATMNINHN